MNRHGERERGYVLFGIVVGLVILGISMTAAVPLWQKVVQREREQELIFRGYQYMQAIELYHRKYAGAYPADVEVLVKEKFLRKAYTDPFSEDGDGEFRLLRQMSPELQQGTEEQQRALGEAAGITNLNRSQGRMRTPGQQTPGPAGATRRQSGSQFRSSLGRSLSDASMGGIVGVASASDEETFYKVPGKEKYKDWLFAYGAQQMGQLNQAGQAGRAGQQVGPRTRLGTPSGPGGQIEPRGQPGQTQAMPGQAIPGSQSPFPGLPPPPGFTQFRFGPNWRSERWASGVGGPAQTAPGAPPGFGPGQRQQPGMRQPGAGQSNFGQSSFGQPGGQQQRRPQQQPRPQQQRRQKP